MPMPPYLYHATPEGNAGSIARNGLEPRSGGGEKYLSMSGTEQGATTLGRQASDIIFRVNTKNLDLSLWCRAGAGENEWRGTETIVPRYLEYRRNLGSSVQRTWRSAANYPQGIRGDL